MNNDFKLKNFLYFSPLDGGAKLNKYFNVLPNFFLFFIFKLQNIFLHNSYNLKCLKIVIYYPILFKLNKE